MMVFALQAATTSFSVYGSALLQTLHHARPILAGYILGAGALAWTAAALLVAGQGGADRFFIRLGAAMIACGLTGLSLVVSHGALPVIVLCVVGQGAGFGMAWSFTTSRIVSGAPEAEQAFASSSMPTAQMIGAAVGAAAAGAIANLIGFGQGITPARASLAGFWLFSSFIPLALAGCWAAWRLTRTSESAEALAETG
jgi:MFS family permease